MTFDSELPCGLLLDICKNCCEILSIQAVISIPACTVCENCIVVVSVSPDGFGRFTFTVAEALYFLACNSLCPLVGILVVIK